MNSVINEIFNETESTEDSYIILSQDDQNIKIWSTIQNQPDIF